MPFPLNGLFACRTSAPTRRMLIICSFCPCREGGPLGSDFRGHVYMCGEDHLCAHDRLVTGGDYFDSLHMLTCVEESAWLRHLGVPALKLKLSLEFCLPTELFEGLRLPLFHIVYLLTDASPVVSSAFDSAVWQAGAPSLRMIRHQSHITSASSSIAGGCCALRACTVDLRANVREHCQEYEESTHHDEYHLSTAT